MENRKKLFNDYFNSIYAHSNTFSDEEYKNSDIDFDLHYSIFLPEEKDAPILDIGCGTGHFLHYLKKRGHSNFLGIDISESQVEFCRNRITANVKTADAFEFLAEKTDAYSVISSNDVIEHISKEKVIPFLELIYNSLKPDGILLLKLPNMSNPFSIDSRYRDFTHECGFTEESIYQVLYMAGFQNIHIYPSQTPGKSLKSLLSRIFASVVHAILRKLFWHQGITAPEILSCRLIVMAKKEKLLESDSKH